DSLNDFTVTRNEISRFDEDNIPCSQLRGCDHFEFAVRQDLLADCIRFGLAEVIRLCFSTSFRHRFSEVCEQDRKPEPERDLNTEQKSTDTCERILNDKEGR